MACATSRGLSKVALLRPFTSANRERDDTSISAFANSNGSTSISRGASPKIPDSTSCVLDLAPSQVERLGRGRRVDRLLCVARRCLAGALAPARVRGVLFFCSRLRVSTSLVRCLIRCYISENHGDVHCVRAITLT